MITNLHRVNYNGTPNKNGNWYVWKEICDKCGKLIYDENIQHSSDKDAIDSKVNLCSECIRYLMDNNIPHEQAVKMYGKRQ